ncbi:hypothetical protein [Butyrivibrio sp. AD3002]|uniref:hypothetical protein n=1 Tax=Butyrivibrio sp. AD3002 TaxID=1280670 RepID=UPI0003F4EC4E|nr:hypothetical protein [Butyrivibrio sp. AD3002]
MKYLKYVLPILIIPIIFIAYHNYKTKPITQTLTREQILSADTNDYSSNSVLVWDDFRIGKLDQNDGSIPVSKLDDPIYCSMNLPSESLSDVMIEAWRDNGHIVGDTSSPDAKKILNFGAVEETTGAVLPDNFSVYIGKMKMYAYSKSRKRWILLDSQPYPRGIYIYTLPWTTTVSEKCKNVTYYDDYARVDLTKDELEGNCLHFWGSPVDLDKADYLYYAASYDIWVSENSVDLLTASGGIDTKDAQGQNTISQLYSSRGFSCQTYLKSIWGTTVPNSEYDLCNTSELNQIY